MIPTLIQAYWKVTCIQVQQNNKQNTSLTCTHKRFCGEQFTLCKTLKHVMQTIKLTITALTVTQDINYRFMSSKNRELATVRGRLIFMQQLLLNIIGTLQANQINISLCVFLPLSGVLVITCLPKIKNYNFELLLIGKGDRVLLLSRCTCV